MPLILVDKPYATWWRRRDCAVALQCYCNAEVLCTGAALTLHAARRAAAAAGSGGVDLRLRCVDLVSRPLFRPLPFFFITVTDIKGLVLDRQNSYFGYTKVGIRELPVGLERFLSILFATALLAGRYIGKSGFYRSVLRRKIWVSRLFVPVPRPRDRDLQTHSDSPARSAVHFVLHG